MKADRYGETSRLIMVDDDSLMGILWLMMGKSWLIYSELIAK